MKGTYADVVMDVRVPCCCCYLLHCQGDTEHPYGELVGSIIRADKQQSGGLCRALPACLHGLLAHSLSVSMPDPYHNKDVQ